MAQMTERMQELLNKVPNVVLATSTRNGIPNAVPVGSRRIIDSETILISDQFFQKTATNLQLNPHASLTYWEGREGYQLKGTVTIETIGTRFEETAQWIRERSEKTGFPLKCKGVVILKIDEIFSIGPGPEAGKQLV
jgi:predicted pyridoxine 5'-phosphate oxidase superfamily flavin-nucleotide-binding protein